MKLMANCNDQLLSSCANIGFDPKMKMYNKTVRTLTVKDRNFFGPKPIFIFPFSVA